MTGGDTQKLMVTLNRGGRHSGFVSVMRLMFVSVCYVEPWIWKES
jgi:hypothetical protein